MFLTCSSVGFSEESGQFRGVDGQEAWKALSCYRSADGFWEPHHAVKYPPVADFAGMDQTITPRTGAAVYFTAIYCKS